MEWDEEIVHVVEWYCLERVRLLGGVGCRSVTSNDNSGLNPRMV